MLMGKMMIDMGTFIILLAIVLVGFGVSRQVSIVDTNSKDALKKFPKRKRNLLFTSYWQNEAGHNVVQVQSNIVPLKWF